MARRARKLCGKRNWFKSKKGSEGTQGKNPCDRKCGQGFKTKKEVIWETVMFVPMTPERESSLS